jgi:hypothetical protein
MIRRIAAVALALILNPAFLHAQETVFTVTVPTASVYKGPSNVTPVIGRVTSGTELNVSRNLGGWVKVAWPGGEDGIGYVRASMGRLGGAEESASATNVSPRPSPAATTSAPAARTSAGQQIPPRGQPRVREISHIFGIGASLVPMSGVGATARAWHKNHLGIQVGFMRDAMTSDVAAGRVTSMQFERLPLVPSVYGVCGELRPPDVEHRESACETARVRQRLGFSRLRWWRADVREHAAIRRERGCWLPRFAGAVCRIQGGSAERVDRRTLVHQIGRDASPPVATATSHRDTLPSEGVGHNPTGRRNQLRPAGSNWHMP